uniref:Uncharacterized protein n=1 Tax=Arion vulgaris TaxID=1028688 RepID=A0A0B6ZLB8_9EUPU
MHCVTFSLWYQKTSRLSVVGNSWLILMTQLFNILCNSELTIEQPRSPLDSSENSTNNA